jgi:hypothetical protein
LLASKQAERRAASELKRRNVIECNLHLYYRLSAQTDYHIILAMSYDDRDTVETMDLDGGVSGDVSAVSHTVPPGEEGMDVSHEGGEDEVHGNLIHNLAGST